MNTKQAPRIFAYTTGVLMLSTLYYVATYNFYDELENLTWTGTVAWLFFLITAGNVTYFISKRFLRKTVTHDYMAYILAVLFVIPIFVQIIIRPEVGLYEMKPVFFAAMTISALVGAWFGVKKDKKSRLEKQAVNEL
jgi:hypothetical protein